LSRRPDIILRGESNDTRKTDHRAMVESIAELRKRIQVPVRAYNDVAGRFVGDHVSLPITRAFLKLNWSPTVATIGMLVFGLIGSILLLFGDGASAVGFALVFLYYVMDCVDGEVARYRDAQKLEWGFYEFFFHLIVKSAFFVCLGLAAVETTGQPLFFAFGASALLATLFQKFLRDAALTSVCRAVLLKGPREGAWAARQLAPPLHEPVQEPCLDSSGEAPHPSFGGKLATLRAALLNFDLSLLYFFGASIADLLLPPWDWRGTPLNLKVALLVFYGVFLPLNFADYFRCYVRQGRFRIEGADLLRRAHHYRVPD
jgi:hypothetical protein